MRGLCLVAFVVTPLLTGCAALSPLSAPTASSRLSLTNVTCNTQVQPEQQVELGLIDRLMAGGQEHAALAQLESKPLASQDHWLRYGQLLASTGRLQQAQQVFQALVERCNTGRAHHGLGMVLLKENKIAAAQYHLKVARERAPADPEVRNDYGYVLLLTGNYSQAVFELRTAMELGDGQGPVRQNLAVAYVLTGNKAGLQWLAQEHDFSARELAYAKKLSRRFSNVEVGSAQ